MNKLRSKNISETLLFLTVSTVFIYQWDIIEGGVHISIPKAIAIILAGVVVVRILYQFCCSSLSIKRKLVIVVIPVVTFQIFEALSALQSSQVSIFALAVQNAGILAWLCLPVAIITDRAQWKNIMGAYVCSLIGVHIGIILTSLGVIDINFGTLAQERVLKGAILENAMRTAGFLVNFGDVAVITSFTLPWLLMSILDDSGGWRLRIVSLCALGIVLIGAIFSVSRNVWVSSIIAVFSMMLLKILAVQNGRYRHPVLLSVIGFLGVLITLGANQIKNAISTMQGVREVSVMSRIEQYSAALKEIASNPLLGPGPGYTYEGLQVHSLYLNALVHAGVGGLSLVGLLLVILLLLWKKAYRYGDGLSIAACSGYLGLLSAAGLYPVILSSAPVFWIAVGLAASYALISNGTLSRREKSPEMGSRMVLEADYRVEMPRMRH